MLNLLKAEVLQDIAERAGKTVHHGLQTVDEAAKTIPDAVD